MWEQLYFYNSEKSAFKKGGKDPRKQLNWYEPIADEKAIEKKDQGFPMIF